MCELSDICTRDLVEELRSREPFDTDINVVVNERASGVWVVSAPGQKEPLVGKGEVIIISVKGLY